LPDEGHAVNGDEWRTCRNARKMLEHLRSVGRAGERKLRLFACAWMRRLCRRVDGRGDSPAGRHPLERALDVVEDCAEGRAPAVELTAARRRARESAGRSGAPADLEALAGQRFFCCESLENLAAAVEGAAADSAWTAACIAAAARCFELDGPTSLPPATIPLGVEEAEVQCGLLREVFGIPHCPERVADGWRTWNGGTVVRLAQAACAERLPGGELAADRLAILADALEEAGCTEASLLGHLRGWEQCRFCGGIGERDEMFLDVGPYWVSCSACDGAGRMPLAVGHVPGCFVLDGLLGKE
jgi:hypothetical protein